MFKRFLLLLIAFWPLLYFGQRAHYLQFSTQDGLAQSQVRAIAQDSHGYLWLGTLNGLSRYDGYSFKNYSVENGLPNRTINSLFQGSNYFWIGTSGSLSRVVDNELEKIPLPTGYESSKILALAEDDLGRLWIGLNGDGILIYNDGEFSSISEADGLPNGYIRDLKLTSEGDMLIGSRGGLISWRAGNLVAFRDSILNRTSVSDILVTKSGSLVVSTFGDGVLLLTGGEVYQLDFDRGFPTNHVRSLVQTREGYIWMGSKYGLFELNLQDLSYKAAKGLSYNNIKSLGTDREQNLWIGTDGQGLFQKAGSAFVLFSTRDGMHSDLMTSISGYYSNKLLFGSYDNGLEVYDGNEFTPYRFNDNLPSQTIWSIERTYRSLWLGTSQGLAIEKGNQLKVLTSDDGLPGDEITALHAFNNKVYLGSEEGFAILKNSGEIERVYNASSHFKGTNVRSIISEGNSIYVGATGLVFKMYGEEMIELDLPSEREIAVYCLATHREKLWIGTSEGLFNCDLNLENIKKINIGGDRATANVNFLESLPFGVLLAGTNHGLYSINSNTEKEYSIFHFSEYEGLPSMESNQNSSYFDGIYVWFGTTSGTVRFDPRNLARGQNYPPEISISNIDLFFQEPNWAYYTDSISDLTGLPVNAQIPYNKNNLTFNYVGIHLSNPKKVRYRYRLNGTDNEWIGPTKSKSVNYAYLPHGDYELEIESFTLENPGKRTRTSFDFSITPPFYLTWWFFTICGITLTAILFWAYRARILKEEEKRANLKLQFQSKLMQLESQSLNSNMNRHFIFNALNSIQYYINLQDRKSANRYLTSFAKLIRKNLDSSQENETSLKDEIERLELYLDLEKMRFQGRFDYEIETEKGLNTAAVFIPAMMLQPFLENSIWHGILPSKHIGYINISIEREDTNVLIIIEDNGIGINTSLSNKPTTQDGHTSKGMTITQDRMALYRRMTGLKYQIEGPIEIMNGNGMVKGTRVIIKIPMEVDISNQTNHLEQVLNN